MRKKKRGRKETKGWTEGGENEKTEQKGRAESIRYPPTLPPPPSPSPRHPEASSLYHLSGVAPQLLRGSLRLDEGHGVHTMTGSHLLQHRKVGHILFLIPVRLEQGHNTVHMYIQ